ncbi:glycoside hydrolase family 16 protein [Temperatibacter marinus]|uniref:Glycoside hydrolase family 16 protein n=1 Tax=Temperatibacter marinus TaxID=1456591 RepID=A0AA52EJU8_9PROT|nr:glycoside hydrolase family 16 protein [Temperatibacter marinus]WND03584.1 glycoside hydrolase family 16 protein [Temperatibacter marinus]
MTKAYFYLAGVVSILLFSTLTESDDKKWTLVFEDNFDSSTLDSKNWAISHGNGCPELCGFGNKELQAYNKDNVKLKEGKLILSAHYKQAMERDYQAGKITTEPMGGWKYGKFSVRAKLPKALGTWPAIWMLPQDWSYGSWPKSGEIDIMEHVGFEVDAVHGTIHTEAYNHSIKTHKGKEVIVKGATEAFHTYTVTWTKDVLIWDIDGQEYFRIPRQKTDTAKEWPFDQKFHLILNVAVGGTWGGLKGINNAEYPTAMEVDWVKVWQ